MNVLTELRYAFYISSLTFIWLMLEYLAGLHDKYIDYHLVITMFAVLIPVVFVYLGMRRKRDVDYDGIATWLQLFKTGMIIAVFASLMIVPLQVAFHYFINPYFFDNMIAYAVDRAAAQGLDVTKAREEALANFNVRSYMIQSGVGMLVLGTILGVLYSFILRRGNKIDEAVPPDETILQMPVNK